MTRRFRNPIPGDTADPQSLAGLLARYLLWMATHHYAEGTVAIRRITLSKFLLWCQERSVEAAAEVTPEMVERYQRHLFYYRKRDGRPLSVSSQAHWLTALRSWFGWMVRQRLLQQSPAIRMQLPREEKRLPRHALAQGEIEAVLAQPDSATPLGLRDRAILETLYSTGLRREEVLNLQPGDIDRPRLTLLVRLGKGRKDRVTPLGARALAWIDKYLAEARPSLARQGSACHLFLTKTGRPIHPNHLSARVRSYLERAGVAKPGACHLFRHTAATLMLEGGADVRYIQAMLGHSSLATTQIYTHVSIGKLRQVHEQTHPGRLYRAAGESGEQDAACE
jgi:integrase/recombinase XerD